MPQTNIQIRIDKDLKDEFSKLCDDLGLTITAACSMFIKKSVTEQRIPFEVTKARSETDIEKIERIKQELFEMLQEKS